MTTLGEASPAPTIVTNIDRPPYVPQLTGVHFTDLSVPEEVLRAVGVADDEIDLWRIYSVLPPSYHELGERDIVINPVTIREKVEGRSLAEFKAVGTKEVIEQIAARVLMYECGTIPKENRFVVPGIIAGIAGVLTSMKMGVDIPGGEALAYPVAGGLAASVAYRRFRTSGRSQLKTQVQQRVGTLLADNSSIYKELHDTLLPVYGTYSQSIE